MQDSLKRESNNLAKDTDILRSLRGSLRYKFTEELSYSQIRQANGDPQAHAIVDMQTVATEMVAQRV